MLMLVDAGADGADGGGDAGDDGGDGDDGDGDDWMFDNLATIIQHYEAKK